MRTARQVSSWGRQCAVAAIVASCLRGGDAPGQVPAQGDGGDAEAPRAAVDNPDVYVNDSFEAADAMVKAQALVQRRRWSEAASMLRRAIDRAEHRLVRVTPGSYVGIRRHIHESIAAWPEEGLTEYRELFERELDSALKSVPDSRSVDELLPLFERYFCTAGAAKLADTIGQLAIESGDLAVAEDVYRRVLDRHPDSRVHSSRYRAMLAILATIRGAEPAADLEGESDVRVRWMGQDRAVSELVEGVRSGFGGFREPESPEHWPIFAGADERNRPATCRVDDPGLLWQADLRESTERETDGSRDEPDGKPPAGRELTMFPVVDKGLVYVQWRREVVALQRATGSVLWTYGSGDRRESGFDYLEDSPPGWDSPTVHEGRVYASLPGDESPYHNYDSPRAMSELVCLDAKSGRLIWRMNQRSTDDPLAEIIFDSSPLVTNQSVYIVGRRRRAFGFEDCYLYRFRGADGSIAYRTHLGSASTGSFGARPATRAIAALDGDAIYVCSNLGTIAAVSAHTGDILWLRLYERIRPDSPQAATRAARNIAPWQFNPVFVSGGRMVCLPTDSSNVLVLSAASGSPVRLISEETFGGIESLFGLRDDLLCGVGKEAFCYDLAAGAVKWTSPLPAGATLLGRGTRTVHEMLIPRRNGISRYRLEDGARSDAPWGVEGEGGNLVALPDMLIAASSGRVSAFVRRSEIWTALREKMAAAAGDPLPALELAEVALNVGEYAEALRVLNEAVRRADAAPAPVDNELSDRFLSDALKFATTLSQRSTLEVDALERLFAVAAQFARTPDANLRYRFAFAELYEKYHQPERAVRLYQQILRDRSLREVQWPMGPRQLANRAGAVAESRISQAIERHGAAVYSAHEAEAQQWFSGRGSGNEADVLQRIVDSFPNSETAPQALIALGRLGAREGRVHDAARQFARAYHRYPKLVDPARLLREIADTYERAGMVEHAYRWLSKAAMEYPKALVEHDGRSWTMGQYRDRLAEAKKRVEPSRPAIRLPLEGRFEKSFDDNATLLTPVFGDDPSSRWSRFFVQTPEGIAAFDSRSGEGLWPAPAAVIANAELLIAREDAAIFATAHEVFALDAGTGTRRWSHGAPPKHLTDPGADWEAASVFRSHALQGNRLVSCQDDGTMTSVAIDSGRHQWTHAARPVPLGRVRLMEPWVGYHAVQDGRAVICLIDAESGTPSEVILADESRPIEDLFVTLDGQVVVVTSQAISSYDPHTRAKRWQAPVSGTPRSPAMLLELDALYFCGDDGELRKIDLDDGKNAWPATERLVQRGETDVTVEREGVAIIVSSTGSVSAVDSVNGLVLWRGTTPEKCRLVARAVTDAFVVAVDTEGHATAYFYDHRNHSGLIPEGGAPDLGELADVRTVLALDHALVIQTAQTIHGFTFHSVPRP